MDDSDLPEKVDRARAFLQTGGQVVGQVAGAAVSIIAGPLLGAGAGVVLGEALARVGAELHDRWLAPRQAARAAGALAVAAVRVKERLEAGDAPRGDGFFDAGSDGRVDAEEVLEGTLLTAANAHEQRKVPLMGRLWANVAFDPTVTASHANYLLRVADRLTYRQLVLLEFVAEADSGKFDISPDHWHFSWKPSAAVTAEMDDLNSQRLIGTRSGDEVAALPAWSAWRLASTALMPAGVTLYRLMELSTLPRSDLDSVVAELRGFVQGNG